MYSFACHTSYCVSVKTVSSLSASLHANICSSPEVRIYNRKQERKKTRKQELDQENDQENKKKERKHALDQEKNKKIFFS